MIRILWEIYFLHLVATDVLLKAKYKWLCQVLQTKNILFWNNEVYTWWKPTHWGCSKNSYSVPVLKIIRKWNAYEKENVYFEGFFGAVSQYLYSRLFQKSNFLLQLLPIFFTNFYQCFYHLPILKATKKFA